eukprot:TRINITY_DN1737_c0_g1_i1.p1 TRINITY_DN1737_c0_g1~~TRINITY_DN1737_c0_g1_i1.p1  ORF type:complete len:167 (+),score=33.14 TRINITY_DN1737_c0_g1_i1:226-726(+)
MKSGLRGIAFTKMNFQSEEADSTIDVNADDFWEQVLALGKRDADDETEANELLQALTEGSAKRDKKEYHQRLKTFAQKQIAARLSPDAEPHVETIIGLLTQYTALTNTFSSKNIAAARGWLRELQRSSRTRRRPNYAEQTLDGLPSSTPSARQRATQSNTKGKSEC